MVERDTLYTIADLQEGGLSSDRYFVVPNGYSSVPDFQNQNDNGVAPSTLRDRKIIDLAPGGSIQGAIDILAKSGGGRVQLQAGTYNLDRDLYLKSDVSLIGNGPNSVIDFGGNNAGIRAEGSDIYNTGTISVSDGSDTVTGYGTSWTSDMIGMLLMISGATYEILAVNSATELEISPVYRGLDITPTANDVVFESSNNSGWTTASSPTVTKPTGLAVGDLLISHCIGTLTSAIPVGFTFLGDQNDGAGGSGALNSRIGWKIADANDVAATDFTFIIGDSNRHLCSITRLSGATATGSSIVYGEGSAENTATPTMAAGVTPTSFGDRTFLMMFTTANNNTGSVAAYSIATDDPSWTEGYDVADSTSRNGSMAYANRSVITATGNISCAGGSASTDWAGQLIAIPSATLTGNAYVIFNPTSNIHIKNLTVQNSAGDAAIYAQYVAGEFFIYFVNVYDSVAGLFIDHCELPTVNIVILGTSAGHGIEISNSGSITLDSLVSLEIVGGDALNMDTCGDSIIHNASFSGADGNGITLANCSNIGIENLSVLGNVGKGCEMTGCEYIQFNMCTFDSNGSDGLKLTSDDDRNIIIQCSFVNNGGYGLNIADSTDDANNHAHNVYSGNSSGTVNNSGTSTATS